MRILVAEDDAALASFVKKGLESEYYAVDVSTDGEEARAMAGELDFDLVVLDLNLPQLDGVAILRFLRTRKPSMPILVLDRAHSGGGPCFVPGPGRGRLSGEAVLFHRTVGSDPGPDAAQPHEQKLRLLPAGWLEHEDWMYGAEETKAGPVGSSWCGFARCKGFTPQEHMRLCFQRSAELALSARIDGPGVTRWEVYLADVCRSQIENCEFASG